MNKEKVIDRERKRKLSNKEKFDNIALIFNKKTKKLTNEFYEKISNLEMEVELNFSMKAMKNLIQAYTVRLKFIYYKSKP